MIFSTAFVVALSGAMMPGPLLTVTISEAVRNGQRAALLLMVGHAILELLLVTGFYFGLSVVLKNPIVIRTIGLLGGTFLLWMGYRIVNDMYRGRISLKLEADVEPLKFGPVLQGVTTSISNPYWTLWWATIGANLVLQSLAGGFLGLSSFYIGHILGDFAWYGLVTMLVITGKRFINDTVYKSILLICALFLSVLGISFILNKSLF